MLELAMLELDLDDRDDIGFVHQVKPIIAGVLRATSPGEVYLVKVDGWFGERWFGFSHKELGAIGVSSRSTLRVPPFVPNRIVSERYLARTSSGAYVSADPPHALHVRQTSADNSKRLVSRMCPRGALFWWTGGSLRDGRGVLMTYLPALDGHTGWYAEYANKQGWTPSRTVRTSRDELEALK